MAQTAPLCHLCGKLFRDAHSLGVHWQRKTPCAKAATDGKMEPSARRCPGCFRPFASSSSMRHHQKTACKFWKHAGFREFPAQPAVLTDYFGMEPTGSITPAFVIECMFNSDPTYTFNVGQAMTILVQIAMSLFCDRERPFKITCFIPFTGGKWAMIKGEQGWEVIEASLVARVMMRKVLDILFERQPVHGHDGIPLAADLSGPTRILRYIADREDELMQKHAKCMNGVLNVNRYVIKEYYGKLPRLS